jgi:hypothetical protein
LDGLFGRAMARLARGSVRSLLDRQAARRYYRWIEIGVFERLFEAVLLDMTTNGSPPTRPSSGRKPTPPLERGATRGTANPGCRRSRGGFGTKLHVVVDALGLPSASPSDRASKRHGAQLQPRRGGAPGKVLMKVVSQSSRRDAIAGISTATIDYRRWGIESFFAKLKTVATHRHPVRRARQDIHERPAAVGLASNRGRFLILAF